VKAFGSWSALGRRPWHESLRGIPAFWSVPLSRWPFAWHAWTALALAGAVGTGGYLWHGQQAARYSAALHKLEIAQRELQQAQQNSRPVDPLAALPLADPHVVDDVLRDLGEFGKLHSVTVASVTIERDADAGAAMKRVRLVVKASAEYEALKSWLGELLARYPSLALSTLSLRRAAADTSPLDASLSLSLYVKAAR
jgi:hypothetical protein